MKPITHAEVLEMLVAARGFVEAGWTQGVMHAGNNGHCSLGGIEHALRRAAKRNDVNFPAERPVQGALVTRFRRSSWSTEEYLRQEFIAYEAARRLAAAIDGKGSRGRTSILGTIIFFNDNHKTTKADVLKAFDRAISRTRNRRPYAKVGRLVPGKAVAK